MLCLVYDDPARYPRLAELLTAQGILLFACPTDTAVQTCIKKDTGALVADCTVFPRRTKQAVDTLHRMYPEMPIAVVTDNGHFFADCDYHILQAEPNEEQLAYRILQFCYASDFYTGNLKAYGLHMAQNCNLCTYCGQLLKLTPMQFRILHCLLYLAPKQVSTYDLMQMCCPSKRCTPKSIAVQIFHINEKAAAIFPEHPLILNIYGKGYRLWCEE